MPEIQLSQPELDVLQKAGIDPQQISFGEILNWLKILTALLEKFAPSA